MNKKQTEQALEECKSVFNASNCPFSEYEMEFIDSVEDQFLTRGRLTERQCEKLQKIWDKI